jgi:hypothetical protein
VGLEHQSDRHEAEPIPGEVWALDRHSALSTACWLGPVL